MKIKLRISFIFLLILIISCLSLYFNFAYISDDITKKVLSIYILLILGLIFLLFYWIYISIFIPLIKLKQIIKKIKEGSFDYNLNIEADCEIYELVKDFEEIRNLFKENEKKNIIKYKNTLELIKNVSHDLKTPVTAIKGYSEALLLDIIKSNEKRYKYINTIYNKSDEIDKLIDELNFYLKIDNNEIVYKYTTVNIMEFFKDFSEQLSFELKTLNIDFEFNTNIKNDIYFVIDVEKMTRAFYNIINNSIKYRDKEKTLICINLIDEFDFVKIEIRDNSRGIDAKDLPFIFERFYRAKDLLNTNIKGSGIGLSIVEKIIKDQGGKVWAKSILGSGTDIIILLKKKQERIDDE